MTQSKRARNNGKPPKDKSKTVGQKEWTDYWFTVGQDKSADNFVKCTEAIADHVRVTLDQGQRLYTEITTMEKQYIKKPKKEDFIRQNEDGDDIPLDEVDKMIMNEKIKLFVSEDKELGQDRDKVTGMIVARCTNAVLNRLKALKDWERIKTSIVDLLEAIRDIAQNHVEAKNPIVTGLDAMLKVYTIQQEEKESMSAYEDRFKNAWDVMVTRMGAPAMYKLALIEMSQLPDDKFADQDEKNKFMNELVKSKLKEFQAYLLLKGANPKRNGGLVMELNNDYAKGHNNFPKTISDARNLMLNHKTKKEKSKDTSKKSEGSDDAEKAVGFTQSGQKKPYIPAWQKNVTCKACKQKGHAWKNPVCPLHPENPDFEKNRQQMGTANAQIQQESNKNEGTKQTGFAGCQPTRLVTQPIFCQPTTKQCFETTTQVAFFDNGEFDYLKDSMLLDNQSTADIFCRADYLTNIRTVPETLHLKTNAGVLVCNQKGELPGYGTVWFDENAITNILSLKEVEDKDRYEISYKQKKGFFVKNLESGTTIAFTRNSQGLHLAPLNKELSLLNTVEEIKSLYTKRQVDRAEKAKALHELIGPPSLHDFKHIIQTNQIKNNPVTIDDVNIYTHIYGNKNTIALKSKSTRPKPKPVVNDYIEIPQELIQAHQGIELCADVIYIEGVTFLITISKNLKFITIRYISDRTKESLLEALDKTFVLYNNAGFTITTFHGDQEFKCVKEALELLEMTVNLSAKGEHEPTIERCNRTVKERFRAAWHSRPFGMIPKIMVIRAASECVKWLNTFPPKGGISPQYSPRAIILGRPVDYDKHCKVKCGAYVQAYNDNNPTNTTKERSIDGIFLKSLDNIQGGYEVLDLKTGQPTTRFHVDELPMPKEVIARVEQLAEKDGFTRHAEPTIRTYALIPGVNDDDSDSESEYSYDSQDDISYQESISDQEVFEMTNRDYFPAGVNHETASDLNQQPPVQELPLPEGDDQSTQSQNQLDSGVENSDNSQQSDEDGDSELEQQQQAVDR